MADLQIIGIPQSSYTWAIRMALAEKGVAYELLSAPPHSPEIDAIHPLGKVPAMRHGDVALFESKAIASYIDRVFPGPRLIPNDARGAAEVEQWVSHVNTAVDPCLVRTYVLGYFFPQTADGAPDRAAIDAVLPAMQKHIDLLDKAVARTGYLAGDGFTFADINLMPILYYTQRFPEGGKMVGAAGHLSAYFARHAERPSFKATTPPPPPGR